MPLGGKKCLACWAARHVYGPNPLPFCHFDELANFQRYLLKWTRIKLQQIFRIPDSMDHLYVLGPGNRAASLSDCGKRVICCHYSIWQFQNSKHLPPKTADDHQWPWNWHLCWPELHYADKTMTHSEWNNPPCLIKRQPSVRDAQIRHGLLVWSEPDMTKRSGGTCFVPSRDA